MCAFDIIKFELTSNHGPHSFANNEFSDEKLSAHKVDVKGTDEKERWSGTFLMMWQQNKEHQPLTIANRINSQFLCCNLNWMNELKLLQIANHKCELLASPSETLIPSAEMIHNHKCDIEIENYSNNLCFVAIYFRSIPLPGHTCLYPIRTLYVKCVNCLACVLMEMHATHTHTHTTS